MIVRGSWQQASAPALAPDEGELPPPLSAASLSLRALATEPLMFASSARSSSREARTVNCCTRYEHAAG